MIGLALKSAKTAKRLVSLALLTATLAVGGTAVPSPAQALEPGEYSFCVNWVLQPFGHNSDRCAAGHPLWGHISVVYIDDYERSGCVNYEGYYGELYTSWNCYGAGTSGFIIVPNDGGSYDGIIRNNNLTYTGKFSGTEFCCN